MHRVVIFTNNESGVPAILIRGALEALASRVDVELAAVCVPNPRAFAGPFCRHFIHRKLMYIESLLDPALKSRHLLPLPGRLLFLLFVVAQESIHEGGR